MTVVSGSPTTALECTVLPSDLGGALSLVSRAVSGRSTLPVLANVLLEVSSTRLTVTATNLDLTVTTSIPLEGGVEGRLTVPAKLLTEYVASLPGDKPCQLTSDPDRMLLKLVCGVQRSTFHGMDAVEFPPVPTAPSQPGLVVDSALFADAVSQTAIAASSDDGAAFLTGVLLEAEGTTLTLAATDRHRLASRTLTISSGDGTLGAPMIVPAKHLGEVGRAISPARPTVTISASASGNQVFFVLEGVTIASRLIEGRYPNWRQVIPTSSSTTVTVARDELTSASKTAAVMAREAAHPIHFALSPNSFVLRSRTEEVGDHEVPLEATVEGESLEISFNARYLLDALSVLEGESVDISLNGHRNPAVLRSEGHPDYTHVIMPVRLPDGGE